MALIETLAGAKISLFVNHRCNLRCRYCYNGRKFDRRMSWDVARRAIDFGFAQAGKGFLQLAFFGGEPLLEYDLVHQAVEYARSQAHQLGRPLHLGVVTNATLVDGRWLRLLKLHGFQVQASLDGCRSAQDANRRFINGRSSFARASAALSRLIGERIPTRVVAVVDPANARWLVQSLDALLDLGARNVYFVPNLSADWDDDARADLEGSLTDLADRWAACLRAGMDLRLDPFNGKVFSHLAQGTRAPVRCDFGQRELAVAPSGRLYPCDRMVKADDDQAMCLGDLDHGLDEPKRQRILAERARVEPECAECALEARCMHRCGCANQELTGDPGRVSPLLCWYEQQVIAQTDRVANALYTEGSPAFLNRFYR